MQAGEIKITVGADGTVSLAVSPSLGGNLLAVLGLLDVARETLHERQRQARVQVATPEVASRLILGRG